MNLSNLGDFFNDKLFIFLVNWLLQVVYLFSGHCVYSFQEISCFVSVTECMVIGFHMIDSSIFLLF